MTTPIESNEIEADPLRSDVEEASGEASRTSVEAEAAGLPSSPGELTGVAVTDPEPEVAISAEGETKLEAEADAAAAAEDRAKPDGEAKKPRPLQALIELLHDLAIAVVVCVLLITYVVQAFKVQGTSMSPELGDGERILVNKFLYRVAGVDRGDVVVFWYPEDPSLSFIKRVVGLPGETIEIRDGVVYVNGEPMEEDYVSASNADLRNYPATSIRPGHYFVLGDNRKGSNDSRSWGFVPERYIYGKAFLRIWPPATFGSVD